MRCLQRRQPCPTEAFGIAVKAKDEAAERLFSLARGLLTMASRILALWSAASHSCNKRKVRMLPIREDEMAKNLPRRLPSLFATVLLILAPRATLAQQRLGAPPGKGSFERYCASCHGTDAKGDGPLANLITPKPADLTLLAKRNNGNFPAQHIAQIIDGREEIAAHGPRDMPVWGQRFGEAGEAAGQQTSQTAVREQIQLLLRYLEKIQQK